MSDDTPQAPRRAGAPGPPRPAPKRYEDQPTGAVPVESKPGSMPKGVRNALIVIGAVVLAATASALFGFFVLADRAEQENEQILGGTDCDHISDLELSEVVGVPVDAFQLGAVGGIAAQITDTRIEIDGTTCLASGESSDLSLSFAVANGGDAEQTFADLLAEAEAPADGSASYLQGTLSDVGDEAFCTAPDAFGYTGVLARAGDRLVYASVIPADPDATPEARCDLARAVAAALL